MSELPDILDLVSKITVAGLLALIVVALVRGWLVPAYRYREVQDEIQELKGERDEWKQLALQGTSIARTAVRIADQSSARAPTEEDRGGPARRETPERGKKA